MGRSGLPGICGSARVPVPTPPTGWFAKRWLVTRSAKYHEMSCDSVAVWSKSRGVTGSLGEAGMSNDTATVVLVHGAAHGAWAWDKVVSRFRSQDVPVVAIDLP